MNTTPAELELAITHLQRALELARFFQHRAEIVDQIALLKRAALKVRGEVAQEK